MAVFTDNNFIVPVTGGPSAGEQPGISFPGIVVDQTTRKVTFNPEALTGADTEFKTLTTGTTLFVDVSLARIGVGTATPTNDIEVRKTVNGGAVSIRINNDFQDTASADDTAELQFGLSSKLSGIIRAQKASDFSSVPTSNASLEFHAIWQDVLAVQTRFFGSGQVDFNASGLVGGDFRIIGSGGAANHGLFVDVSTFQAVIGHDTVFTDADLTLDTNGWLNMKETVTPTATASYGKIYTKLDNTLYFQDGAGAEHSIDVDGTGWTDDGIVVRLTTITDKVGIGTVDPQAPLEVGGTPGTVIGGFASGNLHVTGQSALVNANAVITGHNLFGGNKQLWYFGSESSSNDNITLINRQNGGLSFFTNNLQRLNITNAGVFETPGDLDITTGTGGVFKFVDNAFQSGQDSSNYIEIGHGGSNSFLNQVGAGGMDFRFAGTTKATFTIAGHLHLLTDTDQKHNLKIKTSNNLNDSGIAWENSGGNFSQTIFRTNVGSSRSDLVFAIGSNADIDLLTNSFKIHGSAATEGKLELLSTFQISIGTPAIGDVWTSDDTSGNGSWQTPAGGGTPGGVDTQVQYNNGGAFGGMAALTFNNVTGAITVNAAFATNGDLEIKSSGSGTAFIFDVSSHQFGMGGTSTNFNGEVTTVLAIDEANGEPNFQMRGNGSDVAGAGAGIVMFFNADVSGNSGEVARVRAELSGAQVGNRGGLLRFSTKLNNGSRQHHLTIDDEGRSIFNVTKVANADFTINNASGGGNDVLFFADAGNKAITIGGSSVPTGKLTILDNTQGGISLLDILVDDSNPFVFRMGNKIFNANLANGFNASVGDSGDVDWRNNTIRFLNVDANGVVVFNPASVAGVDITMNWDTGVAFLMDATDGDIDIGSNLSLITAGKGLSIKAGAVTDTMGSAVLVAGAVTIPDTNIAAGDKIFLSRSTTGGTEGTLSYTIIAATSFTITSSSGSDTSTIEYLIIKPL